MSALSHKQTFREGRPMSALPPKADITAAQTNVRFVPEADKCNAANEFLLGRSAPCYSQLSSLISFGQGAPLPVSSSDFRLSRKTAHLVLQWCMNSTVGGRHQGPIGRNADGRFSAFELWRFRPLPTTPR